MIKAYSNGRPLTLDPVLEREPLTVQPVRVESSLAAGFRVGWLDGEFDDHGGGAGKFDLTAGPGVGSPYLVLTVEHETLGTIEEVVDIRTVVEAWVKAAIAAGATPEVGAQGGEQG